MPKTSKKTAKTQPEPRYAAITDARLVALLMYLDNAGDADAGWLAEHYARVLSDADAMLTSLPLTAAFDGAIDRPEIKELITTAVTAQVSQGIDDDAEAKEPGQLMHTVMTPDADAGDFDPITGSRTAWRYLLWTTCDEAMLRGACLMYRLLAGGAR